MISSTLIGARVECDGEPVGYVGDLRIEVGEEITVVGIIVAPRVRSSFLSYERKDMRGPWLIDKAMQFLNRGAVYVEWEDVTSVDADERVAQLCTGYREGDVHLGGESA